MMLLDLGPGDRAHLRHAIESHGRWCRSNGYRLPEALRALLSALSGQERTEHGAEPGSVETAPVVTSYDEAGRLLGVSPRTIRRLVSSGRLPVVEIGGARRIARADIDRFVEGRKSA